MHNYMHQ